MSAAVKERTREATRVASSGVPPKPPRDVDDQEENWNSPFLPPRKWRAPPQQFSILETALITIASEGYWKYAAEFPRNYDLVGMRGRKPKSPDYAKAFLVCMAKEFRSMLAAVTEFSFAPTWTLIREALNTHLPDGWDPAPDECPTLSQMKSFNAKLLRLEDQWFRDLDQGVSQQAVRDAQSIGCLDANRSFSWSNPDPRDFVATDGTVLKPAFGSGPDDSVGPQIVFNDENAKSKPVGTKMLESLVRNGDTRILLAIHIVPPGPNGSPGSESAPIHNSTLYLQSLVGAGLKGVIVDSVIRGKVVSELARQGIIVTNYPHAKSNPNRSQGGRHAKGREERQIELSPMSHEARGKKCCEHALIYVGSVPHTRVSDIEGQETLVELKTTGGFLRKNRDGSSRSYHKYLVPCIRGEFQHVQRLFPEDESGINYGEVNRLFPTNTDQFSALYGRRNDTESWHAEFKRRGNRLPVRGMRLQSVYAAGLLISSNAISLERHRRAVAPPGEQVA